MTTKPERSAAGKVIPGLSASHSQAILARLAQDPAVEAVVLYDSRTLGRQRPGSDIDLCLQAPTMTLGQLLVLDHIDRVGITLWHRPISAPW